MFRKSLSVFVLSLIFFLFGSNLDVNIYDEGIALVGAANILNGKLPYVDFWTLYSPGWFYILALWLLVFGKSIFLVRVFTILINTLNVFLAYKLSTKLQNDKSFALLIWIAICSLYSLNPFYARNVPLSLALSLCALYLLYSSQKYRFVLVGFSIAFLFTIRHDFSIYVFSIVIISFFADYVSKRVFDWKGILSFFISFSIFFLLYLSILECNGVLTEYFRNSFLFVKENFAETRSIPFPNPIQIVFTKNIGIFSKLNQVWEGTIFYFPFFTLFLFTFYLLLSLKNHRGIESSLIPLAGAVLLFSFQGMVRSDFEHIFPAIFFSLILFSKLLEVIFTEKGKAKFVLILLVILLSVPPGIKKINNTVVAFSSRSVPLYSPYAKFIRIRASDSTYNNLLRYLETNCKNKNIFSGTIRHDKIYINDVMIYYLTGKTPPTKYYELHPGLATSEFIQKQIIEDLILNNVYEIVLYQSNIYEQQRYLGSKVLDDFIQKNYYFIQQFGNYYLLTKK